MRLSLSELRKIINEEAEAVEAEPALEPEAAAAPDGQAEPMAQLPDPSAEASKLVSDLGLMPDQTEAGEDTTGTAFARFLTFVENTNEGSIAKLSEPGNMARMLQAMTDYLTLEVMEITNIQLEGIPSKEEFKQKLVAQK